jgi:DNA-directed RNA polymerase specialized sigma24 family protein
LVGNTTIQGLLDTLTDDQRNTLSLHFFEGYTFDEIADERGFLNTLHPIGSIQIP